MRCRGDLNKIRSDRVIEPGTDSAVHASLVRISDVSRESVRENVVNELVFAKGVEEEDLPPGIVWWKVVEEHGNHRFDVEDGDRLCMESSDHGMSLCVDVGAEDIVVVRRRRSRPVQRKLGTCGLLPSMGGFGEEIVCLAHQVISLNDNGRASFGGGGSRRSSNAPGFNTINVGVASGSNLGDIGHEEERWWTAQARSHRPGEERRWRVNGEMTVPGLRKRIAVQGAGPNWYHERLDYRIISWWLSLATDWIHIYRRAAGCENPS
jgi:hypothetical protein